MFVQLLESFNDDESSSDYDDEEPCSDKSNYSEESTDNNEQIVSEGK
jgi:hypothetical protein